MENKLQQLTQKLYNEGLSKGQQEAEQLLASAKDDADKTIAAAKKKADDMIRAAEQKAQDIQKNALTEVVLAGRQTLNELKLQIEKMILLKGIAPAVATANADPAFIKELLLTMARNWNAAGSKVELSALLPADKEAELNKVLGNVSAANLSEGLTITFDNKVKTGFKIGPKDGSYYISFSDADFNALLGTYLRPQVAELLFSEK